MPKALPFKPSTVAQVRRCVERYIAGVLDGSIVTGRLQRLAVERHVRDLDAGEEPGLYFDQQAASRVIRFISLLCHSKGEWAGQPFLLSPWQQFLLWCVFGWKRAEDDTRRFRTAYVEVCRKNGKTTLAAGIGLYMLVADGEAGAEVYTAATKRDQARLSHAEAIRMVRSSRGLKRLVKVSKDNLCVEDTHSKYVALGGDADSTMACPPPAASSTSCTPIRTETCTTCGYRHGGEEAAADLHHHDGGTRPPLPLLGTARVRDQGAGGHDL
jgi:hypothetical protein